MGILSKFKNGFRKGSDLLQGALSKVSGNKALDESDLLELEEALYESDFGVESTEEIIKKLKKFIEVRKAFKGTNTNEIAREVLRRILEDSEGILESIPKARPK